MLEYLKAALEFIKDYPHQQKLLETFVGHPVPPLVLALLRWLVLIFGALSAALAFLSLLRSLREQWRELWKNVLLNEDEKHRCRRRQHFAAFVESQMVKLNLAESWEDYRFAELEAEIETEGKRRWIRFPSISVFLDRGLRRERSLSKALEKSRERIIILEGDPGAGKSVALRHVTQMVAKKAAGSWNEKSIVPIYLNLKQLKRDGDCPIDQVLIRRFVLEGLQNVNSRDVTQFLDEEFDRGLQEGTWFFLFDSFDETPDILGSTDDDTTIALYTEAIYEFLTTFNACRGVIASRQFRRPRRMGLPRFRILPLSEQRRIELVRRSGLRPKAQEQLLGHLGSVPDEVSQMSSNPMFLGLLCEFMHDGIGLPSSPHATFERYVEKRLARDEPKTRARFGVGSDEVRHVAEIVAFAMAADERLGLEPTRGDLLVTLQQLTLGSSSQFDACLDALEFIKLARPDAEELAGSKPRFTFAHRRFQEYFATSVVLREPSRVLPSQLLSEPRWRETAVVMLQTQPGGNLQTLLRTATTLLNGMVESLSVNTEILDDLDASWLRSTFPDSFEWIPGCLHVLGILQDGLSGRPGEMPGDLRDAASKLIITAWRAGRLVDRVRCAEVAAVLLEPTLFSLLRRCMRSDSQLLRDAAYVQVHRLGTLPPDIADWIRDSLVSLAVNGKLRRQRHAIFAHLARLEKSTGLVNCAALLMRIPAIDLLLAGAVGMLCFVGLRTPVSGLVGLCLFLLYLCAIVVRPSTLVLLQIRIRTAAFKVGLIARSRNRESVSVVVTACFISAFIRFLACCAAVSVGSTFSTSVRHALVVASIYFCLWAPVATTVGATGIFSAPAWWPFLPLWPIAVVLSALREHLPRPLALLRGFKEDLPDLLPFVLLLAYMSMPVVAILVSKRGQMSYPETPTDMEEVALILTVVVQVGYIGLAAFYAEVLEGFIGSIGWCKDVLRLLKYVRRPSRELSAAGFLNEFGAWHDDSFRSLYVTLIRRQNVLPATRESEDMVVSLSTALERNSAAGVASQVVATWFSDFRMEKSWRFYKWVPEVLDQLCLLETQLKEQRNRVGVAR